MKMINQSINVNNSFLVFGRSPSESGPNSVRKTRPRTGWPERSIFSIDLMYDDHVCVWINIDMPKVPNVC